MRPFRPSPLMDHSATGTDTCVSGLINFCVFKDTYTALNIAVLTSYSHTKRRRQQQQKKTVSTQFKREN